MRTWIGCGLLFGLGTVGCLGVCGAGRADDTKKGNDSAPTAVQAAPVKNGEVGGAPAADAIGSTADETAASSASSSSSSVNP